MAADDSPCGRQAVRTARCLAERTRAEFVIVHVAAPEAGAAPAGRQILTVSPSTDGPPAIGRWLGDELKGSRAVAPELVIAYGIAGIETTRLAAARRSTLVVLGRRPRAPTHRLVLGETADAVVRRCPVPVLFVPPGAGRFSDILVALDGTERAAQVLDGAARFQTAFGGTLRAVNVELDGPVVSAGTMPRGRSVGLGSIVDRFRQPGGDRIGLAVRHGNPIEEVLAEAGTGPDLLVVGYRRGGPPKVVAPTNIARNLLYAAPCAVLTIPL